VKSDVRTSSIALVLIGSGFLLFQLGLGWALAGHWDARGLINNVAYDFGRYLVFWLLTFAVMFIAGSIFVAKPSRDLARISLVMSAVLMSVGLFALGFAAIWQALTTPESPQAPKFALGTLAIAICLTYQGAKGMFVGFSDTAQIKQPRPDA
jgi:hypothetical protein